ncbi:NAD(P)-dependent alcohol dehydrogenase [Myxococcota bacterium]|nr:NAD(P)-dependent alcohol dehydrogenase [Myxococcota bacterium]
MYVSTSPSLMLACVQPRYGSPDVLRVEEVARPAPGPGEVLVRVHAASVCRGDVHLLTGELWLVRTVYGLTRPKRPITGQNVAGVVAAVGDGVTALAVGDAVFGLVTLGFAEYVVARPEELAKKPANVSFEDAACLPDSGTTALQALRDAGRIAPGHHVLVNGAAGGVGSFAVQLARHFGARVTAVCSARNVEYVRALGADDVVDYTTEDFTQRPARYDVIVDLVGNHAPSVSRGLLSPDGTYVSCTGSPSGGGSLGILLWLIRVPLAGALGRRRMVSLLTRPNSADLDTLAALTASGALRCPIEHHVALTEAPEAVRRVATGHSRGKTVISVLR